MCERKRKAHIFRYEVTTDDGVTRLYQTVADVTQATGISRYYVESFVHDLGANETTLGRKKCAPVGGVRQVHQDALGREVPVIRRRPWYR
jgi:hypothetical protein